MLDFVRLKRNEVAERKDRKPERPEVNEVPDAPPAATAERQRRCNTLAVSAPIPARRSQYRRGGLGIGTGDGEYLPIVKVAPVSRAGRWSAASPGPAWSTYTVTTVGTVKDVTRGRGRLRQ
jgi:protein TonB